MKIFYQLILRIILFIIIYYILNDLKATAINHKATVKKMEGVLKSA